VLVVEGEVGHQACCKVGGGEVDVVVVCTPLFGHVLDVLQHRLLRQVSLVRLQETPQTLLNLAPLERHFLKQISYCRLQTLHTIQIPLVRLQEMPHTPFQTWPH
jgi:hypothetical protein